MTPSEVARHGGVDYVAEVMFQKNPVRLIEPDVAWRWPPGSVTDQ